MAHLAPDLRGQLGRGGGEQTGHGRFKRATGRPLIKGCRVKSPPAGRFVQTLSVLFFHFHQPKNCFVRYIQERLLPEPRRSAVKRFFCSLEKKPNCPFTSGHT